MSGSTRTPPAQVQRANALGRVKLVSGDRQQVDAEPVHVGGNLAGRLRRVGVEEHAVLAGDARALFDRLDRANLVVGVHDADEDRARRDGLSEVVGIDAAAAVHGQIRCAGAQACEKPARCDDGRVLDLRGDDVVPLVAPREVHAFEREVVGLASAAREDHFVGRATEESRNLAAGVLQRRFGRSARPMPA